MTQIAPPSANPLEPITVTLDQRLVAELPRLFGGFGPMLRELFQNAFRAGAQNVTITSGASTLVFSDDGRGITEPAILFRAGATGWDESEVISPAGLGIFAMLNPSIVSSLTVRSRNWEISTTPRDALALEAITPRAAPDIAGTEVRLAFTDALAQPKELKTALEDARGLYPFAVSWNSELLSAPTQPRNQPTSLTITTPDGEISLSTTMFQLGRVLYPGGVIWEHRAIRSDYKNSHQDALGRAITDSYLIFTPATDSAVRPKLPDRSGIEDNQIWTDTKWRLVNALKTEIIARATRESEHWNPEFTLSDIQNGELFHVSDDILHEVLLALGYKPCDTQTAQLEQMYDNLDGEGVQFEDSFETYYTKDAILVRDDSAELVGNALIELGVPEPTSSRKRYSLDPNGQGITLKEEYKNNANSDAPEGGWLSIALSITLNDGSSLPCLIDPQGDTVIIAGVLKTAWQTLHGPLKNEIIAAVVRHQCWNGDASVHELEWFDDRDLDAHKVLSSLERELLRLHGVDAQTAYTKIDSLEHSLTALETSRTALEPVKKRHEQQHANGISAITDQLKALTELLSEELAALRRSVNPLE